MVVERRSVETIPEVFVVSCGASGRGGVMGIETITATCGAVYNGITDVYTRIDNLYPSFVLARVNLPEVTT